MSKVYTVNLSTIWPSTFLDDVNVTISMDEFISDWPDLPTPDANMVLELEELTFVTDYVTHVKYLKLNADLNKHVTTEPVQQYVYDGFLVEKTGRKAVKEAVKTARRIVTDNSTPTLYEVKTVDSIPGFTKWVKDSELFTVVS